MKTKSKKRDDLYAYAYVNCNGDLFPLFGNAPVTQNDLDNMSEYFVTAHAIPWKKSINIVLPFEKLEAYSQLLFDEAKYRGS